MTGARWLLTKLRYRVHDLRPPPSPLEEVWYFAYGANMHDSAFRERRGMRPLEWRPARLPGYRLRFNLEGRPRGKAAPANVSADPQAEVWGVAYSITGAGLARLDASEGVPGRRYRHLWIEVQDLDRARLPAVTYVAAGKPVDGRPSLRYLTLLREGARAHGLPDDYLRILDGVRPAE